MTGNQRNILDDYPVLLPQHLQNLALLAGIRSGHNLNAIPLLQSYSRQHFSA
jgi:hypothetical protein